MKFLCGGCRTKYQISDEKIRSKILTIRCKKCGAKILVRESLTREAGGTAVAPIAEDEKAAVSVSLASEVEATRSVVGGSAAALASSPSLASAFADAMHAGDTESDDMPTCIAPTPQNLEAAGVEWYIAIDGEQSGPFAFAELVRKVQAKEVIGRHYVWHDGMDGWKRVRDVGDLTAYIGSEKKKPPPIPATSGAGEPAQPKSGADVVDFASKRKERDQRRGGSAAELAAEVDREIPDAEGTTQASEGPTEARVEAKGPSPREEQLDHVLNEALGIHGEGATQRAQPGAVAVHATAGVAGEHGKHSVDDLLTFDKDDIFANVPRAQPSDIPIRESTRFFVNAAGVNRQKSRNKMGVVAGVAAGVAFSLFIGAWAVGAIQITIPGIGNPFQRTATDDEDDIVNLDPSDPEQLKKILDDEARRRREGKPPRTRVRVARAPTTAIPEGYVQDTPNDPSQGGTRGDGTGSETIALDPLQAAAQNNEVVQAQLPESGVDAFPAIERPTLSQDTIGKVINEKKKSVSICYQQSLRGNEDLRGKLEFLVTIEPTGLVSRASVETTAFKGTKLARCIATKIKEWRFPPFNGDPQQVQVPFVLEKNSY